MIIPFNNPIAFMVHQGNNDLNSQLLLDELKHYKSFNNYIIAMETTPYVHFHIIADIDINDYNAFIAKVVRKKWKLRGRATNGNPKQYGRITNIKKPCHMIAYTLKQGSYISNLQEITLNPFKDISYTKDKRGEDKELRDKCLQFVDERFKTKAWVDEETLKTTIIEFLLTNNIFIRSRSIIECYYLHIKQYSDKLKWKQASDLYHHFYNLN